MAVTRSQFAEKILYLGGNPLSLDDYKFMRPVYNSTHPSIVLHTSRQISKSTTLANLMIANSVMIPHFKTLYISPTVDQTKIFSGDRVQPVMDESPYIHKHLMSTALAQNVFTKQLKNKSKMYLRYALQSADRLRGISADAVNFDEVQDLIPDIIPVANETMSRSMYKWNMYSGTPKTSTTTLAKL